MSRVISAPHGVTRKDEKRTVQAMFVRPRVWMRNPWRNLLSRLLFRLRGKANLPKTGRFRRVDIPIYSISGIDTVVDKI